MVNLFYRQYENDCWFETDGGLIAAAGRLRQPSRLDDTGRVRTIGALKLTS